MVKPFVSERKCFSTFFNNKSNLVAKIMQTAYFCVIFHLKHKKSPFFAVLTWFLILSKIQDADHCWWRHRPPALVLSCNFIQTNFEFFKWLKNIGFFSWKSTDLWLLSSQKPSRVSSYLKGIIKHSFACIIFMNCWLNRFSKLII